MTPVQHDTQLLALYVDANKASRTHASQTDTAMYAAGFRRTSSRGWHGWLGKVHGREIAESVNIVDALNILNADPSGYAISYSKRKGEIAAAWRQSLEAEHAAYDAITEHEKNYTGWSRFWLVTSSSGHVHSSRDCSTCNKGGKLTGFALLPSTSGMTAEAAVALYGAALCSKCYPDAPIEWTDAVKLPTSITTLLIESRGGGVEAFELALAKWQEKRAAKAVAQ